MLADPMQQLLGKIQKEMGSAKSKVLAQFKGPKFEELWTKEIRGAFEGAKAVIADACTLAPPEEGEALCLYTDASDLHWGAALTQIPLEEMKLTVEKHSHQPWRS